MFINCITPNWPAPNQVRAYVTTRHGGVSLGSYTSLNLGDHVGDDLAAVLENRARLKAALNMPTDPLWLKQVHGCDVAKVDKKQIDCIADASIATTADQVCAILTADCLPLLLCNQQGNKVAAVHAGWRGLANGVIEATLNHLNEPSEKILAWMGPAIGPNAFEVGNEVRNIFVASDPESTAAFKPSARTPHAWMANIYMLAHLHLKKQGVSCIYGGDFCTVSDSKNFFSYRRDQGITGRMASLIWLE